MSTQDNNPFEPANPKDEVAVCTVWEPAPAGYVAQLLANGWHLAFTTQRMHVSRGAGIVKTTVNIYLRYKRKAP